MIALGDPRHAWPDVDDDPRAFMAEEAETAPRIGAGEGEGVGVTDAGRLDLDQDLARAGTVEIDFDDFERLPAATATAARVFIGVGSPWMTVIKA